LNQITQQTVAEPELPAYANLKRTLQDEMSRLRSLLDTDAEGSLCGRIERIADKLARDRFHLAVLGQFKRGKTTVINGLLGADVLPTGVVPLTSIVTLVVYGTAPAATVYFRDDATRAIPIGDVTAYVTERDNPHNAKNVAHVEVAYPATMLRDGVVLVDTPGIGSTYDHNTDVTYEFLPQVDAAVFVASVDPPLSRAERDFLQAIRQHAAKLFFVLNKVDGVTEAEQHELMEFLRAVLAAELGIVEPKIFPLSARAALEAARRGGTDGGLPVLRTHLESFLLHEKGRVAITGTAIAALRIAGEARFLLEVEKKALLTPLKELEEKLAEFDRLRAEAEQELRDFQHLLNAEANGLVAMLDDELHGLEAEAVPVLERALQACAGAHDLKGRHLSRALQNELERQLVEYFESWRRAKEQRLDAEFRRLSGRFVAAANQLIERVVALSAALFDLPPVPLASAEGLSTESRLYYMVGDARVLLSIEPIYFSTWLPGRVTRRFVIADALKHVPLETNRNCGRLRYDFLTRIERSVDRFSDGLAERLRQTLANIRAAIGAGTAARTHSGAVAAGRQASIDARLARLAEVEIRLETVRTRAESL
jgi:GTPase SAR1 family protein